jgi:hypothetical protein
MAQKLLAGIHNFTLEKNGVFERKILWIDSAGQPTDITSYAAEFNIGTSLTDNSLGAYTQAGAQITLGGSNGTIDLLLNATETAAFTFIHAFYQIILTPPAGVASNVVLLEGEIFDSARGHRRSDVKLLDDSRRLVVVTGDQISVEDVPSSVDSNTSAILTKMNTLV